MILGASISILDVIVRCVLVIQRFDVCKEDVSALLHILRTTSAQSVKLPDIIQQGNHG